MNSFFKYNNYLFCADYFSILIFQLQYMYQTCLNCTSFMFSLMIQYVKGYCIPRINVLQQWILSKFVIFYQGCGNIIEPSALCKRVTLIFISGRGSAVWSAGQGTTVSI